MGQIGRACARILNSRLGSGCQTHHRSTARASIRFGRAFCGRKSCSVLGIRTAGWVRGTCPGCSSYSNATEHSRTCKEAQLHAYDTRPENALQALAFLTAFPPSDALQEQILSDNFAGSPQAKLTWPTSSAYEDISAVVGNIAVPTLIVAGEQDRQDPLQQHLREVLPRIPGAQIKVIHDSGHLLPIDQPGQLAKVIRSFVFTLQLRNVRLTSHA